MKHAFHERISNLSIKHDLCSLIGFSKSIFIAGGGCGDGGLLGGGLFVSCPTAQTTERLKPQSHQLQELFFWLGLSATKYTFFKEISCFLVLIAFKEFARFGCTGGISAHL